MTEWKAIDTATAQQLLTRLRDLDWQWKASQVEQIARELGWTIIAQEEGAGAMADAGLGFSGQDVMLPFRGDIVDRIKVTVTSNTRRPTPEARTFLQDAFAALVATAAELFGEPTRRDHGDLPDVQWRGEHTTLSINRSSVAVLVTVIPNTHQDRWDEMEPEPA